ncbi:hypothetical protein [Caballeronia sordidicola]|nr:hypothetical protein [Caballeronia sordidicola]
MASAFVLLGASAGLRPFLSTVGNTPGGLPWEPSRVDAQQYSYIYLRECGELTFLRRMAELERYGLATSQSMGRGIFRLETGSSAPELALQAAMRARRDRRSEPRELGCTEAEWARIHARMAGYVDTSNGWFIQYDNDWHIVSTYREEARRYGHRFLEAEALPDDAMIGDRTFGEWKHTCDQALGRVLAHMNFARLLKKNPTINLSDVLTIFARKNDIRQVWEQAGVPAAQVPATMKALTLGVDGLDDWDGAFETPTPFHVEVGRDFVLLPLFGALTNPYFALFRHLRQFYRADWDRAVDRREDVFRADLARLFAEPRYLVPSRGFRLSRKNGSLLTDIDAIVVDRQCGSVALVQLKWHDIFGFSLAERESRRRNLAKANEWIARVFEWVGGRSSRDVLVQLGIDEVASDRPPALFVLARYAARFAGEDGQDARASWLGWPEMQHAMAVDEVASDPLMLVPGQVMRHQRGFESQATQDVTFEFPGLEVVLQMHVSTPSAVVS